jgi:uncharacterized 2Fe-2S/4Fe-4S cluster protein (DUF4445 family)
VTDTEPDTERDAGREREAYLREGLLGEHPRGPSTSSSAAAAQHGPGSGRVRIVFEHSPHNGSAQAEPVEREVRVPGGVNVFDAASWNGIAIDSTCAGHGTCKKCLVRVLDGQLPAGPLDQRALSAEQLRQGWRLACRATPTGDLRVEVPPMATRPKAATVGVGRQVILRPAVQKRLVTLTEPTLADQLPDVDRLLAAIDDLELRVDLHALRELPQALRRNDYTATAVIVDDVLIGVEGGDTTAHSYGLAVDLGTTTVVATLLDLSTGTPVAVASMLNKQQVFGGDVISRISATMLDPLALARLTQAAHATLAELVAEVCEEASIPPQQVYEVALAGNATMVHLALGIDPEALGVAPFVMTADRWPDLTAADLGITVHPRARAYVFPALGAYVGGDIVAGMLASGMDRDRRLRLFIDVGTNCEIVLGDSSRLVSTAAPAGPAFEGASIRCGMRAADGAVEAVTVTADDVRLQVIGDVPALGLCGSGLVDAVAGLVGIGLLDASGRLLDAAAARQSHSGLADRLVEVAGERVFVLHWKGAPGDAEDAVFLSQRDVRELQFAKAAIATGWRLLIEELGVEVEDIQQVLLAGSFGSYLSPASAIRIGLVPKVPLLRIVSAGNVAGEGAKMTLLSLRERAGAQTLLEEVRYVELSDRPDFNDLFVDQLSFPG